MAEHDTILVVDDQAMVLEFMRFALEFSGYSVITASSAGDALSLCERSARINLAILDVLMPGISGPQLLTLLRNRLPGLPVIFISAFPAGEAALADLVDEHLLHKPFRAAEIVDLVRSTIGPSHEA